MIRLARSSERVLCPAGEDYHPQRTGLDNQSDTLNISAIDPTHDLGPVKQSAGLKFAAETRAERNKNSKRIAHDMKASCPCLRLVHAIYYVESIFVKQNE